MRPFLSLPPPPTPPFRLRNAINFWMRRSAKKTQHATRVNEISTQVKAWATDGKKAKMCTARPGWQTMSLRVGKYKKTNTKIYLGDLCNVLDVNVDAGLVKGERRGSSVVDARCRSSEERGSQRLFRSSPPTPPHFHQPAQSSRW